MRLLVILLIVTFNFSGFSAAASAYTDLNCDSLSQAAHCPDSDTKQPYSGKDHHSDKSKCMDCHSCCVSYSMPANNVSPQVYANVRTTLAFFDQTADGATPPPQLRPPRILA